jgi:hypothetical protein
MMLEQSLISPNFLGKESFRWFIGLVTDYKKVPDGKGGGYKAKVRIIGYHPDAKDIIPDDELPWAHVLVPLNMGSGEGGTGLSFNSRGSETVIGFFMDGDNGQQPVIIGALFSGFDVEHTNTFQDGTDGFKPFRPNQKPINPNNKSSQTGKSTSSGIPSSKATVGIGTGETKTQGAAATDVGGKGNEQTVAIPATCKSSNTTYSKLVQALRSFIKTLNTLKQVQTGFINPVLNTVSDLPGIAQEVATTISDLFGDYIKQIRDNIMKDIYNSLEQLLNSILPKDIKVLKQLATDKIADSIWCAFSKIIKGVADFAFNFLIQLAGAVTNIPICAAQAFVGSIMSTVTNEISDAIGPALNEFSSNVSGTIGTIDNYLSQALNYANQALNFLSCESAECKQQFNYEMNKGFIPQESIDNFQGILNYPTQAVSDGAESAREWLGIVGAKGPTTSSFLDPNFGYCDAVNLECGLPTIQFFGGAGSGAIGNAVVDALGQVMGIYILDGGTGYSNPPYVSIIDPCNNGSGAKARAVVDDGRVTAVIMDEPGSGYLGPSTSTDPCSTNPTDNSGSAVVGIITSIQIVNTGVGYTSGDLISDSACLNDVQIQPVVDDDGRIIDVNIINPGTALRVLPQLTINTQDGEGAVLQPVLSFRPVEPVTPETDSTKIKKVVLCEEDHGI